MIPELGRHAALILLAWVFTLGALAVLVALSFARSGRARRHLERIEGPRDGA